MATRAEPKVGVKVFVDEEKSRVVFAESGREFVDVLFGFLMLPLGTVVRLLGKQSQAGCLDELYKSVEGLPTRLFRTEACKTMLLSPINAAAKQCCQLKVRVDDTKHGEVYVCADTSCCAHAEGAFSSVRGAVCKCEDVKFIVTDDFHVAPASTSLMLSILEKFEVQDLSSLEQRTLQLTSDKMISLLKRSLTSKNPLTGHYFDLAIASDDSVTDMIPDNLHPQQESDAEYTLNNVKIKVLQTMDNSYVLYAEGGADFVDLLLGLLSVSIPLGSIVKRYGKCTSNGCVDNLYSSICGFAEEFLRPGCQIFLLSPNLPPFFGCGTRMMLQVEELSPHKQEINACIKCFKMGGFRDLDRCREGVYINNGFELIYRYSNCLADVKKSSLYECDPKLPKGEQSNTGEAYVKQGPQSFMVMEILKATLVTRKALSTALLPPKEPAPKNMKKLHHQIFDIY
ncbi:uncharacterized protein LOC119361130 [Triticum dicoccoides]|uniref:uncharacterized protein LOC119361130 n=1 Tax=Triticum dicoccoides TaxID=85692 RepID=UPI00188FB59C|nr:uncharacterized protein LOC119361130 [Triticum dicoccoides]